MNRDIFQGNFKQLKGKLKEKWGKLTDEEITRIEGKREQLYGLLETKYGYTKEKAQIELNEFINKYESLQFQQNWNSIRTKIQEKFNSLSTEDINRIKGRRDELVSLLETKYHVTRDQANEKLQNYIDSLRLNEMASRQQK